MDSEENISQFEIENEHLISRGLYCIVEEVIGTRQIVEERRNKFELIENYLNLDSPSSHIQLIRGSRGEGYGFETSDIDMMVLDKGVIIFPENSLMSVLKLTNYHTICRMENSSPGFVLVRLMESLKVNEQIKTSLVSRGSKTYLSSKLFRDFLRCSTISLGITTHGPCLTTNLRDYNYDFCFCLYSPFWPNQAKSFIPRSIRSGWPREPELFDIIKEGCLLVPLNSKLVYYNDPSDLEWRISFSLAEKRLMQSINHIQFLTYGLLKLVLNEVFKTTENVKELFCSYHMKNALFWEISQGPKDWNIENFFSKFWMVFQLLKQWIRNGYCPHFFVPERNMFYGKIYGIHQEHAIEFLESFCEKRLHFLMQCQSIDRGLIRILDHMKFQYSHINRGVDLAIENCNLRLALMIQTAPSIRSYNAALEGLRNTIIKAIADPEIGSIIPIIQMRINNLVQKIATSHFEELSSNRKFYQKQMIAINMLKKIKTFYLFSEFQIVKHLYTSQQYEKTIGMISSMKKNLGSVMYQWYICNDSVQIDRQSGLSYEDIFRKRILLQLRLTSDDTIEELKLECSEKEKCAVDQGISVPPMVFLNFLLLLSYSELQDKTNRKKILRELYAVMMNDKVQHIHRSHRAISWEILGICQQICQQRNKAHLSYVNALLDENNDFKKATLLRLKSL